MTEARIKGASFVMTHNRTISSSYYISNYEIKLPKLGNWEAFLWVPWEYHNKITQIEIFYIHLLNY
jgi:hypothetical protein